MADWTKEQLDLPIAELEPYGLSTASVTIIEKKIGCVYLRDLVGRHCRDFENAGWRGRRAFYQLRTALGNYRAGRKLKDDTECADRGGSLSGEE